MPPFVFATVVVALPVVILLKDKRYTALVGVMTLVAAVFFSASLAKAELYELSDTGPTQSAATANAVGTVSFLLTGGYSRTALELRDGHIVRDETVLTAHAIVIPKSLRVLHVSPDGPPYTARIQVEIDTTRRLGQLDGQPMVDAAQVGGLGAVAEARRRRQEHITSMLDDWEQAIYTKLLEVDLTVDPGSVVAGDLGTHVTYQLAPRIVPAAYTAAFEDIRTLVAIGALDPPVDMGEIVSASRDCNDQEASQRHFTVGVTYPFVRSTPIKAVECLRITNWSKQTAVRQPSITFFSGAKWETGKGVPTRWIWGRIPWQWRPKCTPFVVVEFLDQYGEVLADERVPISGLALQHASRNAPVPWMATLVLAPGWISYEASSEGALWDVEFLPATQLRRSVVLKDGIAGRWDSIRARVAVSGGAPRRKVAADAGG